MDVERKYRKEGRIPDECRCYNMKAPTTELNYGTTMSLRWAERRFDRLQMLAMWNADVLEVRTLDQRRGHSQKQ